MTTHQECPTHLVDDIPADSDAFSTNGELGPHARVAKEIGDLVESDEPGGKMIGLEGAWGSGKSTVVNFLRKKFEKPEHLTAAFFDAWAHEGGLVRNLVSAG
jgi:KAP family P-loop domain